MQVPLGHAIVDGLIVPTDWLAIMLGPVQLVRWPHMLLAAFLTTGMCVTATGAWYMLRGIHRAEARVMLHWGLGLVAVLIPVQLFFGHLTGLYVLAAPAGEVRRDRGPLADAAAGQRGPVRLARRGERSATASRSRSPSSAASSRPATGRRGRSGWRPSRREDWPPVLIPFFTFRIMVGMGLVMLAVSWLGNLLRWRGRLETARWFLWAPFLAFPSGFVAVITGWFTAEVGRQPWVVYGLLRTEDAVTPSLTTSDVPITLAGYVLVYAVISRLRHLLHLPSAPRGPDRRGACNLRRHGQAPAGARRPADSATGDVRPEPMDQVPTLAYFWAAVIAVLDPDLRRPRRLRPRRRHPVRLDRRRGPPAADDERHRAVLGRQRDLAGADRRRPVRAFPEVYAIFLPAFYLPVLLLLLALIFRGVAFEFRYRTTRMRPLWDRGFSLGSTVVAFVQGAAIGAMIHEIPVVDGQFAGGPRLAVPVRAPVRRRPGPGLRAARRRLDRAQGRRPAARLGLSPDRLAAAGVLAVVVAAFLLTLDRQRARAQRSGARPWALIFPVLGALAVGGILRRHGPAPRRAAVRATVALLSSPPS